MKKKKLKKIEYIGHLYFSTVFLRNDYRININIQCTQFSNLQASNNARQFDMQLKSIINFFFTVVCVCVCVCVYIYIYIYIYIKWSGRVFANGPGDQGSILGPVILKTQKMVLDAFLNTQRYKVRIKGKWINPGIEVATSPTPRCSRY